MTTFAKLKERIAAATGGALKETAFTTGPLEPVEATGKSGGLIGILGAIGSRMAISGAAGAMNVAITAWTGTVPGYEQMDQFNDELAAKLEPGTGYAYAAGVMELALQTPDSVQGFDQAAKALNRLVGAPVKSTVKITAKDRTIAEASIELDKFGGGVQDQSKFGPPADFKPMETPKPDAPKPDVPKTDPAQV